MSFRAAFIGVSADGIHGISIYDDKKIVRLKLEDAKLEFLESDIEYTRCSAYSPALDLIAVGLQEEGMLLVKPGAKKGTAQKLKVETQPRQVAFSGDGKLMVVAVTGKTYFDEEKNKKAIDRVELWDTAQWKIRATLPKEADLKFIGYGHILKPWGQMAPSRDGKYLAGIPRANDETTVELWDIAAQSVRVVDKGGLASFLLFTPDGTKLLIGYQDKGVKLVDTSK